MLAVYMFVPANNGRHFTVKNRILVKQNDCISNKISLKFVSNFSVDKEISMKGGLRITHFRNVYMHYHASVN